MVSTAPSSDPFVVHAPGRVNLIGEHTDYVGGLVLPMAIDRGITLTASPATRSIKLTSDQVSRPVEIALPFDGPPADVEPDWGRFIAAVAAEMCSKNGFRGHLTSDIPAGSGLSSSAALLCAIALALGFDGTPLELAQVTQRAEYAATNVPTGIMDQLCIAAARPKCAALIDCDSHEIEHIAMPDDLEVVVQFVEHRVLAHSAYAQRVDECAQAEALIGPLRQATRDQAESIQNERIRQRARHVVTENLRVRQFVRALRRGTYPELGDLLREGHESLRVDYETSTARMDTAVAIFNDTPGVFGARMTGGGFGGCIVALCVPGTDVHGWKVRASAGASIRRIDQT